MLATTVGPGQDRGYDGRLGWRVTPARGLVVAGRYRLLDPLGAGGTSTVWRAYDVRARRLVAVKVLAERHPTALLRLVQEQSLRLEHPHVVTASGWAADDGAVAVAMPLLRGGSVAELQARHDRLPAPLVAVLLDQLLDALEAVHRAGLVHRDVKPANLLLAATGRGYPCLRLADFGVAVHPRRSRLTSDGGVVGTDGYMPAAQASGGEPAGWWDVHAAGVVVRELLLGPRDGVACRVGCPVDGAGGVGAGGVGARDGGAELVAEATPTTASLLGLAARLVSDRLAAAEARALLAEVGVPPATAWPALGMPPVPDVVGPAPLLRRWVPGGWGLLAGPRRPAVGMSTGAYDAPGASYAPVVAEHGPTGGRWLAVLVVLALALSVASLVVALAG